MTHTALDRLERNLQQLRQTATAGFTPQTPEQRIAQEIIVDAGTVAAAHHLPESASLETFRRSYQQTRDAMQREGWSQPGSHGQVSDVGNRPQPEYSSSR